MRPSRAPRRIRPKMREHRPRGHEQSRSIRISRAGAGASSFAFAGDKRQSDQERDPITGAISRNGVSRLGGR